MGLKAGSVMLENNRHREAEFLRKIMMPIIVVLFTFYIIGEVVKWLDW